MNFFNSAGNHIPNDGKKVAGRGEMLFRLVELAGEIVCVAKISQQAAVTPPSVFTVFVFALAAIVIFENVFTSVSAC